MKDRDRWTDSGADSAVDSKLSLSHIKKGIKQDKPVSDLALASRIVYWMKMETQENCSDPENDCSNLKMVMLWALFEKFPNKHSNS